MGTNRRRYRANIRQLILILVALALMGLGVRYILNEYHESQLVHLHFKSPDGRTTPRFGLEIARNASERTKGLMFRKELPESGGMFFAFPKQEEHSFWMKNTYISLDLIFINSELKVVGVLADVPVLNEEQRKVSAPSLYVVELAAGSAKKHGIVPGSLVVVEGQVPRGA